MGRAKRKTPDVYEDERRGLRPGSAFLMLVALGFGGAIVWNAFSGAHQGRSMGSLLSEIPEGASTSVVVPAPQHVAPKTITITYDPAVEDIQRELLATGHYHGLVDGVMGTQTMLAIKQYQKDSGLAIDGRATRELLEHVRFTRKVEQASNQTGSLDAAPATQAKPVQTAARPDDSRLKVLDVQMRLMQLGYQPENTGVAGESTRAAILQFELDNGLAMDGVINTEFLAALKAVEAEQDVAAQ